MFGSTSDPFGALLRRFRQRCHLTQQQLATRIGVHRTTVGRWEEGSVLPESKSLVLEVARHLYLDEQETRQLLEASLTALSPYWYVPLPRNPYFTGREEVLSALHAQLGIGQAGALTQSSALHGLGGVGKTQIALEYAYRHALEYSAVFWMGAETSEQIVASLLHIAEVLQLPEREDKDQQRVVAAVWHWLSTHSQWLLIWDNVEELALFQRFLPPVRQGAVLITTRLAALGTLAQGLDLFPLEQEEALLFLFRRAKVLGPEAGGEQILQFAHRLPAEHVAAEELVKTMDRLPLALDQAGAYIEETACGFSGYLRRYERQRALLLSRRGTVGGDHPRSVATTFGLASERVAQEPGAADLLRACAFLHAESIPEELFEEGAAHLGPGLASLATDPYQLDRAIAALRSLSLVQRQAETRTLSLHRLVQAVVRDRMSEQEQMVWMERIIAALAAVFPQAAPQVWSQCERLLPHVLTIATSVPDQASNQELAHVLRKAAHYLCARAHYEQAEPLYERVLRMQEQALGPAHPQLASSLNLLAVLYFVRGQYERAEPLYQRALHIQEQALGSDLPEVASLLGNLAITYKAKGKYQQAEQLFQRALNIQEQALGPAHPQLAHMIFNLANLSYEQGKDQQAEPLFQRALGILEQAVGPEHPDVVYPLNGLATLYLRQRHYERAEPLFQRALQLREHTLGETHPLVAQPLDGLATLYQEQGNSQLAEPLYRRALGILEPAVGPEHPDVVFPLNGLANLFRDRCRYLEADQLYQRALSIREQQLGHHHPLTAQTLHDLAILRQHQGQRSEALSLAERALSIRSQALGEAHPQTIATQTLSAQLVREQAARAEPTVEHLRSLLKARGWSLHLKQRHDKPYVYATRKVGEHTQSRYLAPLSNLAVCLAAAEALPNAKEE